MPKKFKYIFSGLAILFACSSFAQVKVLASINRRVISANESVNFQVTVEGSQNASAPVFNKMTGFRITQGPSVSTQMSFINGRQSKSVTYSYILMPKAVGVQTIGPVTVKVGNRKYRTKEIKVEVVKGKPKNKNQLNKRAPKDENIFLNLQLDKKTSFVNGQVALALTLYYKDTDITDVTQPDINNKNFFVYDDGSRPLQQRVMIDNVIYNSVRFQKLLIPLTVGTHTIGPFSLDVTIRVSVRKSRRDDFFGDSFFGDIFGSYKTKVISVKSNPVTINVKQLPAAGKPADFNGAVGNFSLAASASPTSVQVGEPVTLTVELSGKGNIDNASVNLPTNAAGFRIYEPETTRDTRVSDGELIGKRTYKIAMVPTSTSSQTIPAVKFSYFDPARKEYVSLQKGPFKLTVKPGAGTGSFKITELAPAIRRSGSIRILNQDIFPIKSGKASLGFARRATQSSLFYLVLFTPAVFWAALAFVAKRRNRLLSDTAFYRKTNAGKNVKARVKNAEIALSKSDGKIFYSEVSDALTNFIADKIHIPAPQVTSSSLSNILSGRRVPAETISAAKEILEACDFGRFASVDFSSSDAKSLLKKCKQTIAKLDKQIL